MKRTPKTTPAPRRTRGMSRRLHTPGPAPKMKPPAALPKRSIAPKAARRRDPEADAARRLTADDKLRESELRYRAIAEATGDLLWEVDTQAVITFVNPQCEAMTGFTPQEILGKSPFDLQPPEEAERLEAWFAQAAASASSISGYECPIRRKDGQLIHTELSVLPFFDRDGKVAGYRGSNRDITQRRRAEDALRQSEATLRSFINALPDPALVLDKRRAARVVNEGLARSLGRTCEELIGKTIPEMLPPGIAEQREARIDEAFRTGKPVIFEDARGSQHYINHIYPILDESGHASAVAVFALDITERTRAEGRVRIGEESLRRITENMQDVISEIDMAGNIVYASPSHRWVLGDDPDVLQGGSILGRLHPEDSGPALAALIESVSARSVPGPVTFRFRHADGHYLWLECVGKLVVDAQGQPSGLVLCSRDVTERMQAEEARRTSEQRMRNVVNASPFGAHLYQLHADGRMEFIGANRSADKILGVDHSQFLGKTIEEAFPGLAESPIPEAYRRVAATGEPFQRDQIDYDEGGIRGAFEIHAFQTQVNQMAVYFWDVTESRRAAAALSEEKQFSEEIINGLPGVFYVYDEDWRLVRWNKRLLTDSGLAEADLAGVSALDWFVGEDRELARQAMQEVAATGQTSFEAMAHVASGPPVPYLFTAVRVPLGGRTFYLGLGTDIAERKRREYELEAIAAVSAALRSAATRADMLPIILDQTMLLFRAEGAALAMQDPDTGETVVELARGELEATQHVRIPPGQGATGYVIATSQPYLSSDVRNDPLIARPDLLETVPAVACVPLIAQGNAIGALWVGRTSEVSPLELRLLTAIADMAANAIRRASLHEQTERRLQQLTALSDIDRAIGSGVSLQITLTTLLTHVTAQLKVDAADVLLLNPSLQRLDYYVGRGFRTKLIERTQVRQGEGYAGRVALTRQMLRIPNVKAQPDDPLLKGRLADEAFVSYFGVPLIAKGETVGVLEVFHRAPIASGEEWVGFLTSMAESAAIAIDNARLFEAQQRSTHELAMAYDATIEGWSHALDLRDEDTEGHTQRVAEVTVGLAREFGLSETELVHIRRGALLHDIGKMGVPDGILLKPGPLSDEEWLVMKRHPTLAYEMLSPIHYLRFALDIPYCHHERWDGTGYPRGLKGEQIPLAARLFSVVDVWDALNSDRPYRAAWTADQARDFISSGAGTLFDPRIVRAFLESRWIGNRGWD